MVVRRKSRVRRGLTQEKVKHLLIGIDWINDGTGGYGRDDKFRDTFFDEEAARRDWEAVKVFLIPEFENYNPGRVCWAAWKFDNTEVPDDQTSFGRFQEDEILAQFPL